MTEGAKRDPWNLKLKKTASAKAVPYPRLSQLRPFCAAALGLIAILLPAAERKAVVPAGAAAPVGPYAPGIAAGDYLYVSGQGARNAKNEMSTAPEQQIAQCIENIKTIVEAGGLTMRNVVYLQAYLADISQRPLLEKALTSAFGGKIPPYSLVGVAKMRTQTPVEISAVATRSAKDRVYLSGKSGDTPAAAATALKKAGVSGKNALQLTAYYAPGVDAGALKKTLQDTFQTAVTTVPVVTLPDNAKVEVTGITTRRGGKKTDGQNPPRCTAAGDAVYCGAAEAAGAGAVDAQVSALLDQQEASLKALGSSLNQAVVNHVYLDNLDEFTTMNKAYGNKFATPYPTRTTIQPAPTAGGDAPRVRVSIIAVRQ